jgi:hypothetical protein
MPFFTSSRLLHRHCSRYGTVILRKVTADDSDPIQHFAQIYGFLSGAAELTVSSLYRELAYERLGIVECGHWAPNHIRTFNSFTKSRVKCVVDSDEERLADLREQFGGIDCE